MKESSADWTIWFDEHGAALILLARGWVNCQSDAEDVVQQAFVRFWRKRGCVRNRLAYLYTCVRSSAADWQRDRSRRRENEPGRRADHESWFVAPESNAEAEERRVAVEAALAGLPVPQRQVLVMKIWSGLTFAQIAEVLSVSPNTAASRYRYALTSLRENIDRELM